jgi:hypothetical protein
MIAELGRNIKKGDVVTFDNMKGSVKYGKDEDGNETNSFCFITVGEMYYLVGIEGRALSGVDLWEP